VVDLIVLFVYEFGWWVWVVVCVDWLVVVV